MRIQELMQKLSHIREEHGNVEVKVMVMYEPGDGADWENVAGVRFEKDHVEIDGWNA